MLLFKTLVELFGYPGRERWRWRKFIDHHKDLLTDDEYKAVMMLLWPGTDKVDELLLKLDPELGDK